MNYLKQFLKGGIFFVACAMVFGFSDNTVFAEPTTETECKALTPNPGRCVEKPIFGSTVCNANEKIIGNCEKASVNDRVCCVPEGSTNDATCSSLNCNGTKGICQRLSCGDGLKESGICDTSLGISQVCCIPDDCTPTTASPGTSSSTSAAALNYTPLENLPGFEGESGDFATYFKNLYLLALWIVGISALFMLVVGGFLYLSSAGNTSLLGTAKKTIYGALIGLVIALISWLLLDTINSDLTNLKLSGLAGVLGGNSGTSTATTPPSGDADPEGCKKLKNLSVDQSQCNLASKELVQMLSCMEGKGISNKWTSISANAVGGDQNKAAACCGASKGGSCPHSDVSCHHGCTYGTKGLSYAVDIGGTSGASDATLCAIASAAKSCGGGNVWGPRTLSCGIKAQDGHNSHLHVSTSGCNH